MRPWLLAAIPLLCSCAGHGPIETILITSNPPGASCTMDREGVRLGSVAETPGQIDLEAKKGTLDVTCSKPGYATARVDKTPGYSPDGGWIGPGGLVFVAVKALGPPPPKSDWHYPAEINLSLLPLGDPGKPLPLSGLRLQ